MLCCMEALGREPKTQRGFGLKAMGGARLKQARGDYFFSEESSNSVGGRSVAVPIDRVRVCRIGGRGGSESIHPTRILLLGGRGGGIFWLRLK